MVSPYASAPLDLSDSNFRLVELQPRSPSGLIRCRLRSYSLPPSCPEYVALSYMWDHASPKDEVELNGVRFPVGHSLWTFLNQMQSDKMYTTFWIDAICIDQSNVKERNHQVQLMGRIYSKAESVSIWLGEAEERSRKGEAMEATAHLCSRYNQDPDFVWNSADWAPDQAELIAFLAEDPYWNRMWIVQEVVLARRAVIHCGTRTLEFSTFERLIDDLETQSRFRSHDPTPAWGVCYFKKFPFLEDLWEMISLCVERGATDGRDRFYAVLGITGESFSKFPVNCEISQEDLWERVCVCYYQQDNGYHSLSEFYDFGSTIARALEIDVSKERVEELVEIHYLSRLSPTERRELETEAYDSDALVSRQSSPLLM
ncbi:Heterokaryon incompatibility protein 6, OR allele 2 [Stagonosporopsis vannaccii]|nr:Heterokaryon incompatibility protein 6, OR allele 2 [Stagonosporopsis vannaccii]